MSRHYLLVKLTHWVSFLKKGKTFQRLLALVFFAQNYFLSSLKICMLTVGYTKFYQVFLNSSKKDMRFILQKTLAMQKSFFGFPDVLFIRFFPGFRWHHHPENHKCCSMTVSAHCKILIILFCLVTNLQSGTEDTRKYKV